MPFRFLPNCEQTLIRIFSQTGKRLRTMRLLKKVYQPFIITVGNYMNYSSKVRYLAEHALSNYEWTVKELGVQYLPDAIGQEGGHSVPRYVTTTNGSGSGIVTKELDKCKELGIPLRNRVFVEHIIRGDNGVEGVQVREGYRFPKADSGKVKTIRATKGVVLCYGGSPPT